MAKRLTDSNKWDHSWIRKLSCKLKCALFYILDKCDHAGLWVADFEAMSFLIGEPVLQSEFETHFQGKIIKLKDDKYFIPSFIDFQYGSLNPENRVHKSVISLLEKEGAYKHLNSSLLGAKDKDMDKEKEKEKDKDKEKSDFDFEKIYKNYPRKLGKAKALKVLNKTIQNWDDFESLSKAVSNYSQDCALNKTPETYTKHFSSFIGTIENETWRDYVSLVPQDRTTQAKLNKSELRQQSNQDALNQVLESIKEKKT